MIYILENKFITKKESTDWHLDHVHSAKIVRRYCKTWKLK